MEGPQRLAALPLLLVFGACTMIGAPVHPQTISRVPVTGALALLCVRRNRQKCQDEHTRCNPPKMLRHEQLSSLDIT